jgi:amidohydrolase
MVNSQEQQQSKIKTLSAQIRHKLIAIRRDLHMHPELSGEEERTAGIVAERLKELGLEVQKNVGGYGVIGVLKGNCESPVVAMRADMDAFIGEDTIDKPYRSTVPGVTHLCGHDVHTSIGLGVAQVLASMKDDIKGTVKFLFQPAEENIQGAIGMIREGALENPRPDAIFAQHVGPTSVGSYVWTQSLFLSGLDSFRVTLSSNENGGSREGLNEIAEKCMSSIQSLNTLSYPTDLVGLDAIMEDVLEGADYIREFKIFWVQPGEEKDDDQPVIFQFFYKAASDVLKKEAYDQVIDAIQDIAGSEQIRFDVAQVFSLPDTINDAELVESTLGTIAAVIGEENMLEFIGAFPFNGEDFSFFQREIPGAMYFLGCANREKGIIAVPHMPGFDVDDECLVVGTEVMSNILLDYLLKNSS